MHSNWTELSLSFSCYFEVIQNMSMVTIEVMTKPERQALEEYKVYNYVSKIICIQLIQTCLSALLQGQL